MNDRTAFMRRPRSLQGVSLIELMVALVIGLILMAGALTVYMQSRNTFRTTDTTARLQEIGRYALDVIEPDVRLAGFWGMNNRAGSITTALTDADIADECTTNWLTATSTFLEGKNASYGLSCAATNVSSRSDTLIVRHAKPTTSAPDATKIQIQSNRLQSTIFKGAAVPTGYAASPGSETRDLIANVYYVSTAPALRRQSLRGAAMVDEEVIPGVEDLQVQFGVDRGTDGFADQYVNPDGVGTGRVVSVRVWILVRSEEPEVGYTNNATYQFADASYTAFNDGYRRIVLSKTIQVRNSRP
jgi:type IV pilus assembly protein PilW